MKAFIKKLIARYFDYEIEGSYYNQERMENGGIKYTLKHTRRYYLKGSRRRKAAKP